MKKFLIGATLLTPSLAAAQVNDFKGLMAFLSRIIGSLIPIVFGIALLGFLWGVVKYISKGGDPKARAEGRNMMIYGIIAFAVMLSVWGLAFLVKNILFEQAPSPLQGEQGDYFKGNPNPLDNSDTT